MTTENLLKTQGSQHTKWGQVEQRWALRFCESVNSQGRIQEGELSLDDFQRRFSEKVITRLDTRARRRASDLAAFGSWIWTTDGCGHVAC